MSKLKHFIPSFEGMLLSLLLIFFFSIDIAIHTLFLPLSRKVLIGCCCVFCTNECARVDRIETSNRRRMKLAPHPSGSDHSDASRLRDQQQEDTNFCSKNSQESVYISWQSFHCVILYCCILLHEHNCFCSIFDYRCP